MDWQPSDTEGGLDSRDGTPRHHQELRKGGSEWQTLIGDDELQHKHKRHAAGTVDDAQRFTPPQQGHP